MTDSSPVFLDANVLIYSIDETSNLYSQVVAQVQHLLAEGVELCTSHHVIEEVLHIVQKLQTTITSSQVVAELERIPDLILVEPAADLEFAKRYAILTERLHMGINDALLLQLMIDAGIQRLYTYDKKFIDKSNAVGISSII